MVDKRFKICYTGPVEQNNIQRNTTQYGVITYEYIRRYEEKQKVTVR
jgi:hypothetical protein